MPTLDWIGKKAVVDHHRQVPFHLLRENPDLSVGDPDAGNLLVQGDNLLALKALLPYYAGKVKCIYIDPPYNTGNEGWVYNDNVNSPEIRRWLGEVVGKEAEDLSRHDKWLCMMYPRLMLLKELLREDGAIFVSIDDNEVAYLRAAMDEVFGARNFVATVIWNRVFARKSSARHFSENHDYLLVYAKDASKWTRNLLPRSSQNIDSYSNPDDDPRGPWTSVVLSARNYYSLGTYPITTPGGRRIDGPPKGRYWSVSKEKLEELDADNRIWWGKSGNGIPRLKVFLNEAQGGVVPQTIWPHTEVGSTQDGKKEVLKYLAEGADVFITPKPLGLIKRILQIASDEDSIILDSFAGSGTTGHAVMQLNAEDGGRRRFILCEMEPKVSKGVTAERLRRVCEGVGDTPGLGGGFRFAELGPTLFDASGRIRDEVSFEELARHVFLTETGTPLPEGGLNGTPLLGVANGTAVYLLYNGILKDKSPRGGNALTREVLSSLPPHDGPKVVYGTSRRVSPETLRRAGVVFRQIPYEILTR
ncbi:site-specific DNA-methyltransferase [Thioalkalivibrio sp.]|uniref:site-specific DNA-methyltransferase n=1 Tax=Thioalkalivibrio sp. TaxID=2093813 RepID=UPI003564A272